MVDWFMLREFCGKFPLVSSVWGFVSVGDAVRACVCVAEMGEERGAVAMRELAIHYAIKFVLSLGEFRKAPAIYEKLWPCNCYGIAGYGIAQHTWWLYWYGFSKSLFSSLSPLRLR